MNIYWSLQIPRGLLQLALNRTEVFKLISGDIPSCELQLPPAELIHSLLSSQKELSLTTLDDASAWAQTLCTDLD